jgi:hypothetical protein
MRFIFIYGSTRWYLLSECNDSNNNEGDSNHKLGREVNRW